MKFDGYYHRALKAADRRYRQAFERMGYGRRDMRAEQRRTDEELTELRAQYQDVVGKRPYHGWDAAALREKIAEARAE